ncbi:hypothetical protein HMPREF9946_03586 [Acetobacteraceae bacterium AT-5844]|nr:hypothetical protein HMPREF9946_03586 [Acetobacteraceae bacterium AT-5844]
MLCHRRWRARWMQPALLQGEGDSADQGRSSGKTRPAEQAEYHSAKPA